MSTVSSNKNKIAKALNLLSMKKDYSAQMAAEKALKAAVIYAMDIHEEDETHHRHLTHDKHYGWILLHNGDIVSKGLYEAEMDGGYAERILDLLSNDLPIEGWEGIVVAGMGLGYDVDFENDVITTVAEYIRSTIPIYIVQFTKRAK